MRLRECKSKIVDQLLSIGIDEGEAQCEAFLILEHVAGLSRQQLFLALDEEMVEGQLSDVQRIMQSRVKRVPIQYCLNECWFYGRKFAIQNGVFIPRSDTECLLETVLQLTASWGEDRQLSALEIGVGSGALTTTILLQKPNLSIVGCDINPWAIEAAASNASRHGVSNRLSLHCLDWRDLSDVKVDFVFANPPYIPLGEKASLQPEVGLYEPEAALFGLDADGLGHYREMAIRLPDWFARYPGLVCVEVADGRDGAVLDIFSRAGWIDAEGFLDLNGIGRVVAARCLK